MRRRMRELKTQDGEHKDEGKSEMDQKVRKMSVACLRGVPMGVYRRSS